ncbi:MAG: class II fumarate hydratase, partial [Sphingomonas sp.]
PHEKAVAIAAACGEVLSGKFNDQFPIDVFQAGSGTSSNMNVNEVLGNLAAEALGGKRGDRKTVHPNDDVNMGESTNNVFPSAIRVAAVELSGGLFQTLDNLIQALETKADEFSNVWKSGRTHLQDAVPMTLGQEFAAWANALRKAEKRIAYACFDLHELGIGGNAIGTGVNTPAAFRSEIIKALNQATGQEYRAATNGIEITQFLSDLGAFSGALKMLALDINKIVNDLRLLASGPNTGFGEILLPPVEPGSSIMPGKINPTQCEMLTMVAAQVIGNHQAITIGGLQGHLELNVFKPMLGAALLRSIDLLSVGMASFAERCVEGIEPNRARIAELVERSLMLVTALAPEIGYDNAAKIAKHAHHEGLTLKEAGLALGLVDAETFDRLVRPETMV